MTTTLYFTKHFTAGLLKGISITESLTFVSIERAEIWRKAVMAKPKKLGYVLADYSYQNYTR